MIDLTKTGKQAALSASEMTYIVSGRALNSIRSLNPYTLSVFVA